MSHPAQSNGGFRPQELNRRQFQEAAAITIDKQAQAIQQTREFLADLSTRLDRHEEMIGGAMASASNTRSELWKFKYCNLWTRLRWLFTGR